MHLLARHACRALLAATILAASISCASSSMQSERLFTTQHEAMATRWQLFLYARNAQDAEALSDEVFTEVDRIEDLLSNYRAASELSRINREAAAHPVITDPETFAFLSGAQHWSSRSDGAFDITVGPLMKTWGFFRKQGRVPPQAELDQLRGKIGWQQVQLDPAVRSVQFAASGVELDPGGIGKGFAVDAALHLLREAHVERAMLSAGSSTIGVIGAPPGKSGWPVISHDPWRPDREVSTAFLRNETLSTANCAEKNFSLDGRLYCHIMDPHTLRPVEGTLQVTVTHPFGTASDALSNALFVLSPAESVGLLQKEKDTRALIVTGSEDHRVCTAIRWRQPIAEHFCERLQEVR